MDTPHLVSPLDFVRRMESHWTNALGNASSDNLRSLWQTMAASFGRAILSFDNVGPFSPPPTWQVLNPPTGTGKSQGTCVYASMVAQANQRLLSHGASTASPVGILIVTRETVEADILANTINDLAGFPAALAKHSKVTTTVEQVRAAHVLIVTHAAYVKSLENFEEDSRWLDMIEWDHGKRRLTVIDETLSNVVEGHNVKAEDIRRVISYVTPEIRREFPAQVSALETFGQVLDQIAARDESKGRIVWRGVAEGRITFPVDLTLAGLRQRMKPLRYDHLAMRKESPLDRQRIAQAVDDTMKAVEAVMSRWAYYDRKGLDHSLNCSRLVVPDDLPAPVVLDATASQQMLWGLMEDRAVIQPIPSGTRNYQNVTLHVARARGMGKTGMKEKAKVRLSRVFGDLQTRLGNDRKVFLCCHKSIKHVALSFTPTFASYGVGTWGAVDGKNDWKDCDVAVIVGLPYKDRIWSTNLFFATQGLQPNEWMETPTWKQHSDIHREMQASQITVEVVQAINRVQCRKVTDEDGNCPPTDVFVVLPDDKLGDEVLDNLRDEMPELNVEGWDFQLDGPGVSIRKGSSHEALVAFMENRLPGETAITTIQKELGLSDKGKTKLMETLRDVAHPLTQKLAEIGVRYLTTGVGKGARSYLIKT